MPMPSTMLSTVDEKQSSVLTVRARSEYRAIVDHDDYQDLCDASHASQNSNNNEMHDDDDGDDGDFVVDDDDDDDDDVVTEFVPHYSKPPKVRHTTLTHWNASLESITEEEEDSLKRHHEADSSSSESTYATYINNVNESPRIYHAGRVWCITKSREPPIEEHQQHLGYLETDIDVVNDHVPEHTSQLFKFDDAVLLENRQMESQNPVLAVMPTPTYLLQGTAIPAAYPGHSQYLAISDDNHDNNNNNGTGNNDDSNDNADRPNYITTESGQAEWTYSFPIASDAFAAALDQKVEPCESTVTYSNVNAIPSVKALETTFSYDQPPKQDDLMIKPPLINIQDASDGVKEPKEERPEDHYIDDNDATDNKTGISSSDKQGWVQTFSSTIIIQAPDISPTIHRENFPDEIDEVQTSAACTEFQEMAPVVNEGYLETDIDNVVMPLVRKAEVTNGRVDEETEDNVDTETNIGIVVIPSLRQGEETSPRGDDEREAVVASIEPTQSEQTHTQRILMYPEKPSQEEHVGDKGKNDDATNKIKSQKGKRFMDKFRRSDSSDSKDKPKKKKAKKSKRRKGKKNERDPFDIDDDEDFTTIHDSDEEEDEEEEDEDEVKEQECEETMTTETLATMVTASVANESEIQPSNIVSTEEQPPPPPHESDTEHQTPKSSNSSHEPSSKRPERSSVRLLCCQAPRMRPSSADSVKSGPYLVSEQISKRQSPNFTEVTELYISSEDDDHMTDHTTDPEFINGIEIEPGQLNIDDIVEEQIEPVSKTTSDAPSEQVFPSIRPYSDAYLEDSPIPSGREAQEFQIPIASSEDDGFDDDELSINSEVVSNGKIIKPKGYAGENAHAFYLIGTPGNVVSGSDVTQQIHSKPTQATALSYDMCTEDKQIYDSKLDKETVVPIQSSIYNHKPSAVPSNQHALDAGINEVENESKLVSATSDLRSTNHKEEPQPVSDSLEILDDAKQDRSDRINGLLTEFKDDVTQEPASKQDECSVTQYKGEKPSEPSAKIITAAKLDPIIATKQPDTFETPQIKTPDSDTCDKYSVHSDASERASLVIAEQRARIRQSLSKLNLPDWYKRSKHHRKVLNDEIQVDYPDYVSEPRFTSCSPTAGGSDWSMDSTGTGSSFGVATKMSFLSEARYRRAYHNYDRYYKSFSPADRPIRSAFSCAELPRGSYHPKDPCRDIEADVGEKYHSSDALLSVDDEPFIERHSGTVLQTSQHHTSTPNLSPSRNRSRSMGESSKKTTPTDCNALSIRRLERRTNDAVFYITGKIDDNSKPKKSTQLVSSGDDSGFNDTYEPPIESRYEIKEAHIRPTDLPLTKIIPKGSPYQVAGSSYHSPPSKPPRIVEHDKASPSNRNHDHIDKMQANEPSNYHFVPITRAQDEVTQTLESNVTQYKPLSAPSGSDSLPAIRPDPRYKPDGSRNEKVSPFPMVTPSKKDPAASSSSGAGSPSRRSKCNVQITITDTSLDEDDSAIPAPKASLPREPISRPKSPIDFDELRESNFAAVLSVVASSKSKEPLGTQSSSTFKPPPDVSMEEIVDSLLGLSSTSRSPSRNDLQDPDNLARPSRQGSVPEINWSALSDHQQLSSTPNKSASLDSLFSDEGVSPLDSIVITQEDSDELSGSSKESTPRLSHETIGDEIVMVKCSYRKCAKVRELEEARNTYKTCHNCYTYYCSRECRLAHWEKHKKKCLYSRINSAAKHVIYNSRYNEDLQNDLSKIARTGYLSRGRGAILLIFPDVDSAESYMTFGMEGLPFPPTYSTIKDLEKAGLFADHLSFLLQMCRTYDPDVKFVLNVAIMATDDDESTSKTRPRKLPQSIKKCAKVRLSMMHIQSRQLPSKERETLILTAPSGVSSEGILDKKSRQICFIHIQRQLRQRGVSLRHQHSDVYDQLCRWVEYHDQFTPVTIYPREGGTGPRFMCVLMPDSDPNDFGWVDNPQLLDSIDLDAELEKLENVVSSAAATKL